jgi:hypothetical protein
MAKITVSFAVDSDRDGDLVRWLDGVGRGGVTLGDVYQAVKALERKMGTGAVVASLPLSDRDEPDAPPDVLAALDSLGV